MTGEQRFERELPDILADLYPVSAPDYRHDLVQQLAVTRQRPAWAFPERWIPMRALELGRAVRPVPWRMIGAVALLLVAIAAAAIIAGSSQRRLPPPFGPAANGQLVLAEDGDIFLIDAVTGARTVAVGGPTVDSGPVFSRDGTQLAFLRAAADGVRLLVSDPQGNQPRALATSGLGAFEAIQWSPDGTAILAMKVEGEARAIAIVPLDGTAAKVLDLGMSAEDAVWLPPSGLELLFRTPHPDGAKFGYSLQIVRADGSNLRPLVAPGQFEWDSLYFAPSPDGSSVVYQQRASASASMVLYVVPTDGGTPRAITSVESVLPVWSPDGAWIAFKSDDGLYVVRTDPPAAERRLIAVGGAFAWAPDGRRLLFQADGQEPLLLDPVDGSQQSAPWTSASFPDWQRLAPTD